VCEAFVEAKSTKVGRAVPLGEPGGLKGSADAKTGLLELF
jgi:hypothetical protein